MKDGLWFEMAFKVERCLCNISYEKSQHSVSELEDARSNE